MNATALATPRGRDRTFSLVLSAGAVVVVFAGFAETFYLNAFFARRNLTSILYLHGAVFTAWFVLLLAQVVLVAIGRTDLHRRLGGAGAALACSMVPLGVVVAVHAAKYGSFASPPGVSPLVFLVVPFFDIVVFGILTASGLLYRHRPQIHKRLMLLSALSILTPAVVRIPLHFIHTYGIMGVFAITDLFVVAYVVHDALSYRRLHPACFWGGLLIIASGPIRFGIGGTEVWFVFAKWLTR